MKKVFLKKFKKRLDTRNKVWYNTNRVAKMFENIRDSRSAIQWLTNTYLLDERSVDIVRDILLYIGVNFEDMDDKKYMVRNLLRTFDLNNKEVEKIASVI